MLRLARQAAGAVQPGECRPSTGVSEIVVVVGYRAEDGHQRVRDRDIDGVRIQLRHPGESKAAWCTPSSLPSRTRSATTTSCSCSPTRSSGSPHHEGDGSTMFERGRALRHAAAWSREENAGRDPQDLRPDRGRSRPPQIYRLIEKPRNPPNSDSRNREHASFAAGIFDYMPI